MKAVEAWQKRKIYAIAGSLKFVDKNDKENDILHMIVYNLTMKTSVKDLTFAQANLVIDYLVQQQNKSIPEVMSEGQKKKVFSLMYQLKELDAEPNFTPIGERLAGIIERQFKVRSTPKYLFTNLSKEDGNRLIEILKNYISTAERKFMN
ncbi:phage protein GemA/Gp16 family protein [Thomasclavelia ramosa]|uniref:phage protein GemA/Gp16 family protein n=1 Tax=Thomasclavelia ramosa TaxID=1547 RepID=UPI0036F37A65